MVVLAEVESEEAPRRAAGISIGPLFGFVDTWWRKLDLRVRVSKV